MSRSNLAGKHVAPLELAGVVHLMRPTGARAHDLATLRAALADAAPGVWFAHTVQHRLRFSSAREAPEADLAHWVGAVLQDLETAERLAFAIADRGGSADAARSAVLEVLDAAAGRTHRAPDGGDLLLLEAESVRVPTGVVATTAPELFDALEAADPSVWFHHLIERPWCGDASASFAAWLRAQGDERRAAWFGEATAAGGSLAEIRDNVLRRWRRSRIGARTLDAARRPEGERREAGRTAVASLVRRLNRTEEAS